MQFSKSNFKTVSIALIFAVLAIIIAGITLLDLDPMMNLGRILGYLAAILFCVILIPGILRRLKSSNLKTISQYIMFSRAQLGISMFFLALGHYLMLIIVPLLKFDLPVSPRAYFVFGLLALFLSFWLALTSNQFSKRILKGNWRRLHSLVYIIVWLIFLHTALIAISPISILVLGFAVLETYSLWKSRTLTKV